MEILINMKYLEHQLIGLISWIRFERNPILRGCIQLEFSESFREFKSIEFERV